MSRAYTLIEILIVIAIVAILTGLASLSIVSYGKTSNIETSKAIVVGALSEARANSMAVNNNLSWGVHLETGRIIIFADSGAGFNPADPLNQTRVFSSNTSASWALAGGGSEIVLAKRTGKTANFGTITLVGANPPPTEIEINSEGRINY